MTVRITKSEKESYWYAKHIGEVFEVNALYDPFGPTLIGYKTLDGGFIKICDCYCSDFPSDCEVITDKPIKK